MNEHKESTKKIVAIVKFMLLLLVLIGIPVYIYFFQHDIIDTFKSREAINAFLVRNKVSSIFIYIGLQAVQIVFSIIPGQILQFAAGYAYAFWLGYLYSIIGITIGTMMTFYIARLLGKGAMRLIFGEERFNRFIKRLNSKRGYIVVFVIFLIPGIPKDIFSYAAGVSEIKLKPFLILSLLGRTPALMGSIMMGSMFHNGSNVGVVILICLAVVLCVLGLIFRKRLMGWIDSGYDRLAKL